MRPSRFCHRRCPIRSPGPPTPDDNILIFVDLREERPCAAANPVPLLRLELLQETVIRLYGPETTGQIDPESGR